MRQKRWKFNIFRFLYVFQSGDSWDLTANQSARIPINPHGQSAIRKLPKEPAETAMEAARAFHVGMAAAGPV